MKENKFQNQWGIWYTYQLEKTQQEGQPKTEGTEYSSNIQQVFTVRTPSDLAFLWKHSPIALPSNYFGREGGKVYTYLFQLSLSYVMNDKVRRINSI